MWKSISLSSGVEYSLTFCEYPYFHRWETGATAARALLFYSAFIPKKAKKPRAESLTVQSASRKRHVAAA